LDGTVREVTQGGYLEAAEPCFAAGGDTVVIEKVPLVAVLDDGVVGGPSDDGGEDDALIDEGATGVAGGGVTDLVGVAGGIGEVKGVTVTMHPRGFEETVRVFGAEGITVFVQYHEGGGFSVELEHVFREADDSGREGSVEALREERAFDTLVARIALELSSPEASAIEVTGAVFLIFEDGGVDAVTAAYGVGLGDEGAGGAVGDGDAEPEDVVTVFEGEVEVITAIAANDVAIPKLPPGPWDIFDGEDDAVVGDRCGHGVTVDGENVVIDHVKMIAVVVFRYAALAVVGGVDVELAVENVDGRVGHIIGGEKVT
jgi:hypothetical protein